MGLTSALNTSLNGLGLNETSIDVLGNNIANAGTNGFKASTVLFTTQLSRTLSVGSAPNGENAGTNPRQIGLGATTAAINKDFTQGGITNSTSPSDLAIQGDGFFVLQGSGGRAYSRAGNFALNSQNLLANATGSRVQGYTVNDDFELQTETLVDIEIRVGLDKVAQETDNVSLAGSVKTSSDALTGTLGSIITSDPFTDTSGGDSTVNPIDATTLLSSVFVDNTATRAFTDGETLLFSGTKGEQEVGPEEFVIDDAAAQTVQDLLDFIEGTLGIFTTSDDASLPDDGGASTFSTGVNITAAGEILIVGNIGELNDISVNLGDVTSDGLDLDLGFRKTQDADGESALVELAVFDSLGQQVDVKVTAALESRNSNSTTYRYFIESVADSNLDIAIGTGTLIFDGEGLVIEDSTSNGMTSVTINRADTAANTLQFDLDFSQVSGIVANSEQSDLLLSSQDGSAPGTLTSFVIDESGVINGVFDNGIIRTLGQVVLARFPNAQGLVETGQTSYREGVSSGPAQVVTPGNSGAGTIRSGAIELSNTDLGRNLVDLIVASTNYRGNARVISSVQQLVDELLVLGR